MIFRKNRTVKPAKQQVHSLPVSTINLSDVEVNQEKAEVSVRVYGAADNCQKLEKKLKKCGEVVEIVKDRGGLTVTYNSPEDASSAVLKLHGTKGSDGSCLIVCRDFAPPLLTSGHKSGLYVIKDVPEETSIPDLWGSLKGDENAVTHMSFLRTSSRHVLICCEEQGRQAILESNGTRLGNWRLKVELWFEFCFSMTRRNVLLIENLPEDSNEASLKQLLGVNDGIEYIEVIDEHNCALVYCKSKDIVNSLTSSGQEQLKISLHQQVAGLRYMTFLDNLHETTKESDIHKLLRKCGNVLKINLSLDQRTGLKRAVAYFEKEKSVGKALLLNGCDLLGQTISVSPSLNKKSSNAVYITNLHRGTQGLHLCLIFQDCGHINSVHVPKQKNIVNSREAGVVVFRDVESISKALEKSNKSKIRGMRISVHVEDPYEGRGKRGKSRKKNKLQSGAESSEKSVKRKNKDAFSETPTKKLKTQ